jgi:hypothetical protein
VDDIYNVEALESITGKVTTYWGLDQISKVQLLKDGNYVVHLIYNVGTSKMTVAEKFEMLHDKPTLELDENRNLVVEDWDYSHINHRATIYYLGGNTTVDIYNEAALKAIDPGAITHWHLERINMQNLSKGGRYVIYLSYNVGTSAKQTEVFEFNIELPLPSVWLEESGQIGTIVPTEVAHRNYEIYYLGDQTVEDIRDIEALKAIDSDPIKFDNQKQIAERGVLTEKGNYVLVMYYNYSGSPRQYIAVFATLN